MINTNLLLLLLLLSLLPLLSSFNLETRAPVVKLGGDYINSFFGFSVAQHKTGDGEPVILIGAPQDRNLQPGTERSGALYRCPLSSDTGDCLQVVTDGKRHNSGPYNGIYDGGISQLKRPVRSEIKDGQWLGVAVSSQGRTEIERMQILTANNGSTNGFISSSLTHQPLSEFEFPSILRDPLDHRSMKYQNNNRTV